MIVLDEQLNDSRIINPLARWYPGAVVVVNKLLSDPHCVLQDHEIPRVLRKQKGPTFVTINWADFWFEDIVDDRYCILCLKLDKARKLEVPAITRHVLELPDYDTKAKRLGTMLLWADGDKLKEKLHQT